MPTPDLLFGRASNAFWTPLDVGSQAQTLLALPAAPGGGGGLARAMVLCSRLQLAAPTGRSPFAALPFPFLQ